MVDKEVNTIKRVIYLAMMNNKNDREAYKGIYSVYQDFKNGKIGIDEAMDQTDALINKK